MIDMTAAFNSAFCTDCKVRRYELTAETYGRYSYEAKEFFITASVQPSGVEVLERIEQMAQGRQFKAITLYSLEPFHIGDRADEIIIRHDVFTIVDCETYDASNVFKSTAVRWIA